MLIYYRFNNFCSFNQESEFDMTAPGGKVMKRFPDNYVNTETGYAILKTAVIVGENAGGKSNFIMGLRFLKSLFTNNSQVKSIYTYVNSGSLKEDKSVVQEFEVTFLAGHDQIYTYLLQIDLNGIVMEKLSVSKNRNYTPHVIMQIERMEEDNYIVSGGDTNVDLNRIVKNGIMGMGLFVTKLALLGNEHAMACVNWMNDVLCPDKVFSEQYMDVKNLEEDIRILQDERYLDIFRMVDYSICGIHVDMEKPYSKTMILRRDGKGSLYKRELQMDSAGVKEFFSWAVRIFRVVYENKVVFADEMDRVLNPVLSDRVIAFVNGKQHHGQFIFSTHNVLHLDLKTYMKEQIYFITKDKEKLTSELYALSDFPEVRYETTKIYEFYMKGILGGTAFE